jgi:hypothetical protein
MIRRVIIPDGDEAIRRSHALPDETLVEIDVASLDPVEIEDSVEVATGKKPPSTRCAVVRDGRVVGIIAADPNIDAVEGCDLVLSDNAIVGMVYEAGAGFRSE